MNDRPTALERAFQLAKSGRPKSIDDIKRESQANLPLWTVRDQDAPIDQTGHYRSSLSFFVSGQSRRL